MEQSSTARMAGLLYLLIIALGLTSEIVVRAPLLAMDAAGTAAAIAEIDRLFRLSILADAVMVAADIALAYLLFRLLSPVGEALAALAALFRLTQAALIAGNLLNQQEALLWIDDGQAEMALHALKLHGAGYDLGLIFFGVNSVLTGILLIRSPDFARALGWLLGAAGVVYLSGSGLRILAPGAAEAFMPAYLIAVVAETGFAISLLRLGRHKPKMVGDKGFEPLTSSM